MTDRREFIHKLVRWGTVVILAGTTLLVGKKIVVNRDCSSCPEYTNCPGIRSCTNPTAGA